MMNNHTVDGSADITGDDTDQVTENHVVRDKRERLPPVAITKSFMRTADARAAEYFEAHPSDQAVVFWDGAVRGFGLRVSRTGARSYILQTRIGKGRAAPIKRVRIKAASPDDARDIAIQWQAKAARGEDFHASIKTEAVQKVRDLAEEYWKLHASKRRTAEQTRRILDGHVLPAFGRRDINAVTAHDVQRLHHEMANTPTQANRVLSVVSKMFNLGIQWRMRSVEAGNPAKGVTRYEETPRELYLKQAQVHALLEALDAYEAEAGVGNGRRSDKADSKPAALCVRNEFIATMARRSTNAIRLIMFTGCRRGEAMTATWGQFDLEEGVWTKPSSHTKQKRTHRVTLSGPALDLLISMKPEGAKPADPLFPAARGKASALVDLKRAWSRIRAAAGVPDLRLHDLRHTFATLLIGAGFTLPVIGAALGHTKTQTTQRYAHVMDEALRAATDAAGRLMARPKA